MTALASENSQKWSDDIVQAGGEILIISQFTLFGQLKGNKVDFHRAMNGRDAQVMYDALVTRLHASLPGKVQTGVFGAMMQVEIINDGREC